ncbi:MAG: type IV secretory system conjugative DNA transfer family protein [Anaerolineae bacterium]
MNLESPKQRTDGRPRWLWPTVAIYYLVSIVPAWLLAPLAFEPGSALSAGIGRLWFAMATGPIFTLVAVVSLLLGAEASTAADTALTSLCAIPFILLVLGALLSGSWPRISEVKARRKMRNLIQAWELRQGRLLSDEFAAAATVQGPGFPLAELDGAAIGLPQDDDAGHVFTLGPTRAGKGLAITQALLSWHGAAFVIDPKGEQLERVGASRERDIGPVYVLPGDAINLDYLFPASDPNAVHELHRHLMRPWLEGNDRIFADKALALFRAAAKSDHMLRSLARWAAMPMEAALSEAMQFDEHAVLTFTNGKLPPEAAGDRFVTSAWGTFTTKLEPFAPHVRWLAQSNVPIDWAEDKSTIFITWPLQDLGAVGPAASALIAGLMRHQLARYNRTRKRLPLLMLVDELPSVALDNISQYMATAGGAGVILALYAQSYPQLLTVYKKADVDALIGNARSQVYYPPADIETARLISQQFGTRLEISPSVSGGYLTGTDARLGESTRYVPALEPASLMALPSDRVVLITQGRRTLAQRLDPRDLFDRLPPYRPAPGPRVPELDVEAEARLATKRYRSNNGRARGPEQGPERLW